MMFQLWCLYLCISLSSALPNIVILLADDLGIGDVGCFGNHSINTVNIDAIASSGVKLSHHLTAAAVCTPSRTALLTGRYPIRSGMESSGRNKVLMFIASSGGLPENETTIAKALKQKGYATALIGKWHLGNDCEQKGDLRHHPLSHGFDHFYGIPFSNFKDLGEGESVITAYIPHFYKYLMALGICGLSTSLIIFKTRRKLAYFILLLTVIFPLIVSMFLLKLNVINGVLMRDSTVVEQPIKLEGLTQRLVKEATEFIENSIKNDTPFFLYMPFVHVHTALFSKPEFRGKSMYGRYGDNILELDWAIGQITKTLKEFDVMKNTFLYFSSDNGGHIEEYGANGEREGGYNGIFRGGKTMAGFEGGIRVPSIISWPSKTKSGIEVPVPTSQMDLFPTIMEIAGIPLAKDRVIDGKSIVPLLSSQERDKRSPHNILFHYCGVNIHAATYIPDEGSSVWKLHWTTPKFLPGTTRCGYVCHCFGKFVVHHDPPLLYDLTKDPAESKSLDITSQHLKDIVTTINRLRDAHQASVDKVPDQFSFMNTIWKPWLQPCCSFPKCFCRDTKYESL